MSIEVKMQELIDALNANTAARNAENGGAASTTKASTASTTKAATTKADTKPKGPSRDETVAIVNDVKEKLGADAAKALIKATGAAKLAEVADGKLKSLFDAATEALAAPAPGAEPEDDGL